MLLGLALQPIDGITVIIIRPLSAGLQVGASEDILTHLGFTKHIMGILQVVNILKQK